MKKGKIIFFFMGIIEFLTLQACNEHNPNANNQKALQTIASKIVQFTNAQNNDSLMSLYADSVKVFVNGNLVLKTRTGLKDAMAGNFKTMPDIHIVAEHIFTDGNSFILEQTTDGNFIKKDKPYKVHQNQVRVCQVENNKIRD